jgi:hypothetical protein
MYSDTAAGCSPWTLHREEEEVECNFESVVKQEVENSDGTLRLLVQVSMHFCPDFRILQSVYSHVSLYAVITNLNPSPDLL